jgi:hypothetical protein
MDFTKVTWGAEYEFGDINRNGILPQGLSWNAKDYSIVSSTGIANDPKGLLYGKGAEINSDPTATVQEQLDFFESLLQANLGPQLNHRTNLHLHVRVPGLSQDLNALKTLLGYIDANQAAIYEAIEPVPVPVRTEYESEVAYKGAVKRYRRRKVSHQYAVPKARVERAMEARTVAEFFAAHAPVQADGNPAWGLTTRAGINLLQLKETDTVEFRHFTNTLDVRKLASCFLWVETFIPAALDGAPVEQLVAASSMNFPEFVPYNHAMEVGYEYTNFQHHSRRVACGKINMLRNIVDIDNCTAEQTVEAIKQIEGKLALESV